MHDDAGDIDWYQRTGHCGACGCPGDWCQCPRPCGCRDLHPVGSGIGRDPAVVFAEVGPVEVGSDQGALFETGDADADPA